jgi:CBS domain-containing protein
LIFCDVEVGSWCARDAAEVFMRATLSQVMTRGVETTSSAATLEEAAKKMRVHNIGFLPVVDDHKVVGVITDRDIVIRAVCGMFRPEMVRVREVMTPELIACYEDEGITKASFLMEKNLIHRLVVLDRRERLAGVVSLSDIAAKTKDEMLSGHILAMVAAA